MKKKSIIIGLLIILLITFCLFYYSRDNIRFKFDYELVNKVELVKGKKIKVNIPINNRIKYIKSGKKLIEILKNKTAIIYMGYETCPWCRNAIPILIDSVIKNDLKNLYYLNIHDVDLSTISEELYTILDAYLKVKDDGTKVIAVPDVYAVKNGKIVAHHRGCVEEYKNPYKSMSDEQKKELKDIYDQMIKEIK